MKNLFFLASIAFLALSSCSGDDNNSTTPQTSLTGTWQLQETSLNNEAFELSPCQLQNTIEFTDTGRVTFRYYYGNNTESCQTDAIETGDYIKNGNTVTITWDESDEGMEVYQLTVTELSDTNLKWQTNITGEGQLKETYLKL
ncbi:lipocalin family protein [Flavobacterium sp. C4GT6]|uniref:lipocalin family protein n=1 Tax=Flavobacterium sp. C4GT6 TaxID=3103818 RepID=UPI002ED4E482